MRHGRQDHREAGAGPRGPRPRRHGRRTRPPRRAHRRAATGTASSPGAPGPRDGATPSTPSPPPAADRPARATSRRYVGGITGSRPTAAGPTRLSNPAYYLWTSKHGYSYLRDPDGTLDVSRDRHAPPTDCPAPDPAQSGATGTPTPSYDGRARDHLDHRRLSLSPNLGRRHRARRCSTPASLRPPLSLLVAEHVHMLPDVSNEVFRTREMTWRLTALGVDQDFIGRRHLGWDP